MFIFPVQLTTSRIGNLTRLIHTLLYVMTIHTYIHTLALTNSRFQFWSPPLFPVPNSHLTTLHRVISEYLHLSKLVPACYYFLPWSGVFVCIVNRRAGGGRSLEGGHGDDAVGKSCGRVGRRGRCQYDRPVGGTGCYGGRASPPARGLVEALFRIAACWEYFHEHGLCVACCTRTFGDH